MPNGQIPKPERPIEAFFERLVKRLSPIIFVTGPLAVLFLTYLVRVSYGAMPIWVWAGGWFCIATGIIACAGVLDIINKDDD